MQYLSNQLEWVDSSQSNLDQREPIRNLCDSKLQNVCAQPFNFKIIFALRIFETFASKVFPFTFFYAMLQRAPVGKIQCPYVKDAKDLVVSWWYSVTAILPDITIPLDYSTTLHTSNIWNYAPNGSRWVHRNAVIRFTPNINTHLVTTFWTPKGELPITMYQSIDESTHLVSMQDNLITQPRTTYCELFQPYSYLQQQDMFHHSTLIFWQLIYRLYGYLPSSISTKPSGGELWNGEYMQFDFFRFTFLIVICLILLLAFCSIIFLALSSILLLT